MGQAALGSAQALGSQAKECDLASCFCASTAPKYCRRVPKLRSTTEHPAAGAQGWGLRLSPIPIQPTDLQTCQRLCEGCTGRSAMPPPAILSLSGLQRFGKQAASLFLLCSGPVFISFIQRVPGKVLKLATGIICFSSCLPQADAARLPVLPCSPAAPALQRIPCTRVCVCVCREGKQPQAFCGHLQLPSSAFVDVCPRPPA